MIQLIKKGGLRERANRSKKYNGSENTETTLKPNRYNKPLDDEGLTEHSESQPLDHTDASSSK